MKFGLTAQCLLCHFNRNVQKAQALGDDKTAAAFARELMKVYLDAPEEESTTCLSPQITALFQKYYGLNADRYREEKERSNRFVLARMDALRQKIAQAPDPLYAALQFAVLGNYIDFAALQDQVDFGVLDGMLEKALATELDREVYAALCQALTEGKRLLYLTDNAGEIGFDRLAAEEIAKRFPGLSITFCVRGGPAANDATREDAQAVGIPFPVIDNGNTVPGTLPRLLGREAKAAMEAADVILAKGQGNTETLYGWGYPVFYLFLVKCPLFEARFGKPQFTPILTREP